MATSDQATTFKVGIDVGGTFTDLFLWSSEGDVQTFKVLSTPKDPSIGVLDGLRTIAEAHRVELSVLAGRIDTIVHGTTVTTNAVLTRRGAKTGLITTEGVRDALEMRRGIREEQYDNRYQNVVPLVPRHLRLPVRGRLDWRGAELTPLDLDGVRVAAATLRDEGVEAVAICFMNAFADDGHERAAAEIVRQELSEAFLSVSSEVLPTVRFYNRVSTTALNAYVGPVLRDYIGSLTGRLAEAGFDGVLLIMQSSGGVGLPDLTLARPAVTLLSGPAAGPGAGLAYVGLHGGGDALVVDMGGTSFDASLVRGGEVAFEAEGEIDRLRIALPMLEIVTIGAGGGSIGWIDAGGLLRMGPQSAGAAPGPACYGRGGTLPACTDADLVLGYLDPRFFAGGKLPLDVAKARTAIAEHVADPLGLDVEGAAAGMYRVINANMAHGVRELTMKRGLDAREFPMVVAGGAGALHACMIADELEIPHVLVPAQASILCAVGMLMSDLQHDFVRSCVGALAELEPARLDSLVAEMIAEGQALLDLEGVPAERAQHAVSLDLRYLKQYHEVTVPVSREAIAAGDHASLADAFHAAHDRLYGYQLAEEGTGLELINIRVRSVGRTAKPELPKLPMPTAQSPSSRKGERRAFVPEWGCFESVPVHDGHRLVPDLVIEGPALIERVDTTIFVSASFHAHIDRWGNAALTRIDSSPGGAA